MKNNYYSKLPNAVRYDNRLSDFAKILYSEIALLAGIKGYCWATNKHLGTALNASVKKVSQSIKLLCKAGFINAQVCKGAGFSRRIFVLEIEEGKAKTLPIIPNANDEYVDTYCQNSIEPNSTEDDSTMLGGIDPLYAEGDSTIQNETSPIYIENNNKNNNLKEIKKRESARAGTNSPSKTVTPPTLCEVQKYIADKNLPVNAKGFFDYYEAGNWVDGNGKKVISWKQKLITWANSNHNSKNKNTTGGKKINYDEE